MSIRLLTPFERRDLVAHLRRLDPASRAARFGGAVSDGGIASYVDGIDLSRDVVIGYHDGDCVLRGAAHLAMAGGVAELGLSVEQGHRRRGVGTRLLDRALDQARFRAAGLTSQCMAGNAWMTSRLRERGCHVVRDMGTATATMSLAPADAGLAVRAFLEEQAGWAGYGGCAAMAGMRAWTPSPKAA